MADDDITVASTTDEMADVEAAAEVTPQELAVGRTPAHQSRNEERPDEPVEDRDRAGRGGFQKRIDRLTREKYQNLDRIQQLEARLREVEAGTRSGIRHEAEGEAQTSTDKPAAPTHADADPRGEQPQAVVRNEEAVARQVAEHQAREVHTRFARDYEAALPKGSPERTELDQAAARTQAEVGGIHPGVAQIVMAMPNSIDVYAHLCTHPDDLRVLNGSRSHGEALANVRYMSGVLRGMVQAQHAQPSLRPRPAVKRAPAPITPTRGGASPTSVSLEDADYQTFKRAREQQEKNRYRY